MSEQAYRVARSEFVNRLFVIVLLVFVVLSLGIQTVLAVQDSRRIEQNDEIQQFIKDQAIENGALSRTVRDCVTPGGECFERGQEQTADAVGDINRVAVIAAACATSLPEGISQQRRVFLTQSCVIQRLADKP